MTGLITNISAQRSSELRKYAAERRRLARLSASVLGASPPRTSRRAFPSASLDPSGADHVELQRLAGLDSSLALTGDSLGAELDGHLIAAVAIDGTASLADPFASTADVRALLELRASQLRAA